MKRINYSKLVTRYSNVFSALRQSKPDNFSSYALSHQRRILNLYAPVEPKVCELFFFRQYFFFAGDAGSEALVSYLPSGERLIIPFGPGEVKLAVKAAYHFRRLSEQYVCLDMPDEHVCWEQFNHDIGMFDVVICWSALLDLARDYWRP
jgi:hypothetical protein